METGRPGRSGCRESRSGWKIGGLGGVGVEKTRSGWKIGGLEGVVAEKLDLDGNWEAWEA